MPCSERLLHVQAAGCEDAHRNLPQRPGTLDDLAGGWIGAWTPCDVADLDRFFSLQTQFGLPRVHVSEFILSYANCHFQRVHGRNDLGV